MDQCPQMDRVVALVGEELDGFQQARVISHIQRCPTCRTQVARISWLARAMRAHEAPETPPETPHLTDLEVAAFATNGRLGGQAKYLEAHLARCAECARLVAAVRKALDEYEDVFGTGGALGGQALWWVGVREDLRRASTEWWTTAAAIGALVLYLGQCALLALALAHTVHACVPWPPTFADVPSFWPLSRLAVGPVRLAGFLSVCISGAVVLRLLAGWLYRLAVGRRPPTNGGR